MNEEYLDNLILTEYVHHIHILEEPEDIPEVKIEKKPDDEPRDKEMITLDLEGNASEEATKEIEGGISDEEKEKNLLEFEYEQTEDGLAIKADYLSQSHPFADWLDLLSSKKNKSNKKKSKNAKNNHLIDEFIETNPKITPKKDLSNEDRDFAEESTKEKPDFFTETLAQIYIKQQAYDKAISAYEKLSLKYPEKSTYFADQIENIKKLSNSDNYRNK